MKWGERGELGEGVGVKRKIILWVIGVKLELKVERLGESGG